MAKKYVLLEERPAWKKFIQPTQRPYFAILDLGITFGTVWALWAGILTLMAMNGKTNILSFARFLELIYPGYSLPLTASDVLLGVVFGFIDGFLFGLLAAWLYNVWRAPQPCSVKLLQDLTVSNKPVVISDGDASKSPFTIAIIANPIIESAIDGELRPDPILQYPKLFQAKVACIIGSLASNRMIREEFLDKMRIMSLFDPSLANQLDPHRTLCLEQEFDVIIEPIQRLYPDNGEIIPDKERERLGNFLRGYTEFKNATGDRLAVDVVYIITASTTHTRSSALYSIEPKETGGPDFTIELLTNGKPRSFPRRHPPFPDVPGMIAYSAWDNRLKTPLHEFAHAMSSTFHGLIHDEYYDDIPGSMQHVLIVNKRYAGAEITGDDDMLQASELPDQFARYTQAGEVTTFRTDRARLQPESWRSFVPARKNSRLPCTMDRSDEQHNFDLMIQHFMRRRLEVKTSRA